MAHQRGKKIVKRLFVGFFFCAVASLLAAAFVLHPAFGLIVLFAIFFGVARILAEMYKDLESGKIKEPTE